MMNPSIAFSSPTVASAASASVVPSSSSLFTCVQVSQNMTRIFIKWFCNFVFNISFFSMTGKFLLEISTPNLLPYCLHIHRVHHQELQLPAIQRISRCNLLQSRHLHPNYRWNQWCPKFPIKKRLHLSQRLSVIYHRSTIAETLPCELLGNSFFWEWWRFNTILCFNHRKSQHRYSE